MLLPLTNLKAIVTGGSRGIGFAIAKKFAHLGANVCLVARRPEPLEEAVSRINSAIHYSITRPTPSPSTDVPHPGPLYPTASESTVRFVPTRGTPSTQPPPSPARRCATSLAGDVSLESTWDTLFTRDPYPHILVNAAGVAHSSLLYKTTTDQIDSVVNTNLRSTILGCRAAGRAMMKLARQSPQTSQLSIINVSSVMATSGQAGAAAYAASKAGILGKQAVLSLFSFGPRPLSDMSPSIQFLGLTAALSREYGHFGVRVNAILPGYIDTDMIAGESFS